MIYAHVCLIWHYVLFTGITWQLPSVPSRYSLGYTLSLCSRLHAVANTVLRVVVIMRCPA